MAAMRSRAGRTALIVVGVVALLVGVVFAGQGANLIPGSSMTGDRTWLYIGLALALVGVVLLVLGVRRRKDGS
ncbi:LPXTG-motif cell wall anchor domain-containing protein [Herbiconiux ginsengi]|uniref:LPXTG-motif cell wall anchor domain-containing protein n=2 Tax=Herbiconiux ginsengi TaxID=381665 RepID=A0A1H3QQW2_9MICO|nr:LPXTG-motif cell wall anchor domain-containing protein [Herbiconiux ginsengi]